MILWESVNVFVCSSGILEEIFISISPYVAALREQTSYTAMGNPFIWNATVFHAQTRSNIIHTHDVMDLDFNVDYYADYARKEKQSKICS